ncbi:MAG: AraC family transcriptional regulator [Clostridiaceae bacterium]|nr:AraC family transcriptional regulator [Clostridiaceae bacterium]
MEYKEHIQKAIDFIEDNLKHDISLSECARAAGYSLYHFLRIFREVTGLTPADYIRKRRLTEIIKKMNGSKNISDIAFEYGFNSKENFTRAFKTEHHILPGEYKSAGNSLKLYEKLSLDVKPFYITPELVRLEPFSLTVYRSDEEYPPHFWNKYNCRKLSKKLTEGKTVSDYGVSEYNGKLNYYIGVRTEHAEGDTSGTVNIIIPGGLYAVFTTPLSNTFDFVSTIHRTWQFILNVWLPDSGYVHGDTPAFEVYNEKSRSFQEEIYIPVIKKG